MLGPGEEAQQEMQRRGQPPPGGWQAGQQTQCEEPGVPHGGDVEDDGDARLEHRRVDRRSSVGGSGVGSGGRGRGGGGIIAKAAALGRCGRRRRRRVPWRARSGRRRESGAGAGCGGPRPAAGRYCVRVVIIVVVEICGRGNGRRGRRRGRRWRSWRRRAGQGSVELPANDHGGAAVGDKEPQVGAFFFFFPPASYWAASRGGGCARERGSYFVGGFFLALAISAALRELGKRTLGES